MYKENPYDVYEENETKEIIKEHCCQCNTPIIIGDEYIEDEYNNVYCCEQCVLDKYKKDMILIKKIME